MKSFKDWVKALKIYCLEEWASESDVKAIQLDAYKAGMRRAAMVESKWLHNNSYNHMREAAVKAILTAADELKEVP